jgi:hypothetical protein
MTLAEESNGIAEAFVKNLKRDYAKVTLLSDVPTEEASVCSLRVRPLSEQRHCRLSA